LSIKKKELKGIEIFPNPAVQQVVSYKISENVNGNIIAELYNMQGKLLVNKKLHDPEGALDLRNYNLPKSNSYILKISFSSKTYQKIILL